MAVDHIRYDILTQEALRGVLRRVLEDTSKHGLPGEHHFFVDFDTNAEGVKISPRLKAQYPEVMRIVLQHQFWDLKVGEQGFEVGLSFGGIPERLSVPFEAIKGFFDPSVQFGLQFETVETAEESESEEAAPLSVAKDGVFGPAAEPKPARADMPAGPAPVSAPPGSASNDEPDKHAGAEVVRLDRFRKK
jgi:hypothetical protein